MSITETVNRKNSEDDEIEIRLSEIVQFLKDSRWAVFRWAIGFLILGIIYAFSKPNQYSVQVTVMPEIQSKAGGLGGLGSLAGLAGIDVNNISGGNMDAIRPDIYPDVLQSVPFALHLLHQPVYSQLLKKETSLQAFLEEQAKQTLLGRFSSSDNTNETTVPDPTNRSRTLQITKKEENLAGQLHEAISAIFDKKTGVIAVTATFSDPIVAATAARLSLEYLTNYITNYRTEKARNQVRFLTNQAKEAKSRYQKAEFALSAYRDQNRSLYLNTAKIEEQRLQADFMLTQTVFNDISKQLEQSKIKVAEESPIFKILEPARVPLRKSGPKRLMIVAGFSLLGALIGLMIFFTKRFIRPTAVS